MALGRPPVSAPCWRPFHTWQQVCISVRLDLTKLSCLHLIFSFEYMPSFISDYVFLCLQRGNVLEMKSGLA